MPNSEVLSALERLQLDPLYESQPDAFRAQVEAILDRFLGDFPSEPTADETRAKLHALLKSCTGRAGLLAKYVKQALEAVET